MADKIPLKSPTDFADPKDWRAYIRETVPSDEVDYTLAFGRTTLFIRFYEGRGLSFPDEFRAELNRIKDIREPERTALLEALNGRIFTAMTQLLLGTSEAANSAIGASAEPTNSRETVENLLDYLAKKNASFALWTHYSKQIQQTLDAPTWEEFVAKEFNGADDSEAEFTLLMGQLGKLLAIFRDRNLVFPTLHLERIQFLHHLRGPERNLQARAIVQYLLEVIAPCASA
ncbi:hypothetical protein ACOBR2_14495 [Telmatobacter bradus]|uniref:hypothetical protein n=1 Tax=Telmatobacter bradus TaxID=474953 RepID=UPI003B4285FD